MKNILGILTLLCGGLLSSLVHAETISGSLLNTNNEISHGAVQIFNSNGDHIGDFPPDSNGDWSTQSLSVGNYFAVTKYNQNVIEARWDGVNGSPCLNSICDILAGTPIVLSSGADVSGIDFRLDFISSGGHILGHAEDDVGNDLANLAIAALNFNGDYIFETRTDNNGNYQLPLVSDDTYYVRTHHNETSGFSRQLYNGHNCLPLSNCPTFAANGTAVVVNGSDIGNINFVLSVPTGSVISGKITDDSLGAPLYAVTVNLIDSSGNNLGGVQTDKFGDYYFSGLVVGDYKVYAQAVPEGYTGELYENVSCPNWSCNLSTLGTLITVNGTANTSGIDIGLTYSGTRIFGTVTRSDTGEDVSGSYRHFQVRLFDVNGNHVGGYSTDHNGQYQLNVAPGDYYLITDQDRGFHGLINEGWDNIQCSNNSDCSDPIGMGATLITVAENTTVVKDFILDTAPSISGTVTAQNGGALLENIEVCVARRNGSDWLGCNQTDVNGIYKVQGLPAEADLITFVSHTSDQHFQLETYENHGPYDWENGTGIDISMTSATGINFALEEGFFISGTVLEAGSGNPIEGVNVCIHHTDGSFAGICRNTGEGGVYQVPALPTGTDYVAYVLGEQVGYKRQLWNNIDCPMNVCDFSSGTPISIGPGDTAGIDFNLLVAENISEQERNALVALYNSTDGANWTDKDNWLVGDPCIDSWFGIVCGGDTITEINLGTNNLNGSIPVSIGDLTNIQRIDLRANQLNGTIPSELGSLSNLSYFNLRTNMLTGNMPIALGGLANLEFLYLFENQLSGSIPSELGNLTNLRVLHISNNLFSSNIPAELGSLNNLTQLYLYSNQLSGAIPPELGNLNNLILFSLDSNQLSGQIPAQLGNLTNITELYLNENQLTGAIPPELSGLTALEMLELSGNQLTGTIPSELIALTQLKFMFLKDNLLSGPFPAFVGSMNSLENIWISDNYFSGSIPSELGDLTNLNWLTLSRNLFTGMIPIELKNMTSLEKLHLQENQLSGEIPHQLSELTNLTQIYLYENHLEGEIPASLGLLSNLTRLLLYSNNLTGSIPPELGNLTNMRFLYLYLNKLSGSIPPELGNLTAILRLYLFSNKLSGTIPEELGNLDAMERLFLFSNQLTGPVPSELVNLTNLAQLKLELNALYTDDNTLIDFMNNICGCDWSETQTTAPVNGQVIGSSNSSISLNWDAVSFQKHGGYKILMSENITGPFSEVYETNGKMFTAFTKGDLVPETDYYFQIKTFTYPVYTGVPSLETIYQQNLVVSDASEVIPGSTVTNSGSANLYANIESEELLASYQEGELPINTGIGNIFEYSITVGNSGPDDAIGAGFRHNVPTGLINTTWMCETNSGVANCPIANGTGNVDLLLNLPVNTSLKFTFTGEISEVDEASLLITSTITPPDGISDTDLEDNDNANNFVVIFANGFE